MQGWISLHRKILKHWVWDNEKYLKCWLWFLIRANHKGENVLIGSELIKLKRGEFVTSIFKITKATKLTNQNARTLLKLLENDKMINKQSTSKLTKITILNYEDYQVQQQTNNKLSNKQTTNKQQTSNKQTTTDNNVNNDKISIEDVKTYFDEKGYIEKQAIIFFNYYNDNDWKDKNGKEVNNWKLKAQAVWFKDEHKKKERIKLYGVVYGDRDVWKPLSYHKDQKKKGQNVIIDMEKWRWSDEI